MRREKRIGLSPTGLLPLQVVLLFVKGFGNRGIAQASHSPVSLPTAAVAKPDKAPIKKLHGKTRPLPFPFLLVLASALGACGIALPVRPEFVDVDS